jgi:hypothetical protein
MLKIIIELHPFGVEEEKRVIHTAFICNTGEGSRELGEYRFQILNKKGKTWRKGRIKDFPRLKLNAWDLLYRCLNSVLSDRNTLFDVEKVL